MPRTARPTLKSSLALRLRRAIAMRVSTYKRRGRPVRYRVKPLIRTKRLVRGSDGELHVEPQSQHHVHGSFNAREAARAQLAIDRGELKMPSENLASERDDDLQDETEEQDALTRDKFTVAQLTKAIQARKPQIHERTVRRYLSRKEPLTREAAVDLILGCWTLGFRLPNDILEEVSAEEVTPRIIVFPGESEPLADILAAKTARLLSLDSRAARRVRDLLRGFLERYERLNKTALGREQMDRIFQKYTVISPMGRIQIMDREARQRK